MVYVMSSKTRMLGAGRAGSTAYGSNVNMVQFGDKLQGLAPQATQFFIRSGRASSAYFSLNPNRRFERNIGALSFLPDLRDSRDIASAGELPVSFWASMSE